MKIKCEVADTFLKRFIGLSFRKKLDSALLIKPCDGVHMCFMRFSIDVVYLDEDNRIKKIVKNLKPWTGLSICLGAKSALEMNSGDVEKFDLKLGQKLELVNC